MPSRRLPSPPSSATDVHCAEPLLEAHLQYPPSSSCDECERHPACEGLRCASPPHAASPLHAAVAALMRPRSALVICLLFPLLLILALSSRGIYTTEGVPYSMQSVHRRGVKAVQEGSAAAAVPFKKRIVHLDMKGAPPRVLYLTRLFPILRQLKVEGLLIEWEDTLPWTGELEILRAEHAYSEEDVKAILKAAEAAQLEVIPLVQTFGHMEFVLKHSPFVTMRERQLQECCICPSREETPRLIADLLQQVRRFHPNATRVHIGADEAYFIGEDELCEDRLKKEFRRDKDLLKLDHISKVAKMARDVGFEEVFAWNDMFDKAPVTALLKYNLSSLITPIVWGYAVDVLRPDYFPRGLFNRLSQVFPRVWFASAFKGANGADNVFIDVNRYLHNHIGYTYLYGNFSKFLDGRVEGIVVTGWSRYSHRQPLCELLPTALPSLVLNLLYLQNVTRPIIETHNATRNFLNCAPLTSKSFAPRIYNKQTVNPLREDTFADCAFPSSDLYAKVQELRFLRWKWTQLQNTEMRNSGEREKLQAEVRVMENELRPLLSSVLFDSAVEEFIKDQVRKLPYIVS